MPVTRSAKKAAKSTPVTRKTPSRSAKKAAKPVPSSAKKGKEKKPVAKPKESARTARTPVANKRKKVVKSVVTPAAQRKPGRPSQRNATPAVSTSKVATTLPDDVEVSWKGELLSTMKVGRLREILEELELDSRGLKVVLRNRLRTYILENPSEAEKVDSEMPSPKAKQKETSPKEVAAIEATVINPVPVKSTPVKPTPVKSTPVKSTPKRKGGARTPRSLKKPVRIEKPDEIPAAVLDKLEYKDGHFVWDGKHFEDLLVVDLKAILKEFKLLEGGVKSVMRERVMIAFLACRKAHPERYSFTKQVDPVPVVSQLSKKPNATSAVPKVVQPKPPAPKSAAKSKVGSTKTATTAVPVSKPIKATKAKPTTPPTTSATQTSSVVGTTQNASPKVNGEVGLKRKAETEEVVAEKRYKVVEQRGEQEPEARRMSGGVVYESPAMPKRRTKPSMLLASLKKSASKAVSTLISSAHKTKNAFISGEEESTISSSTQDVVESSPVQKRVEYKPVEDKPAEKEVTAKTVEAEMERWLKSAMSNSDDDAGYYTGDDDGESKDGMEEVKSVDTEAVDPVENSKVDKVTEVVDSVENSKVDELAEVVDSNVVESEVVKEPETIIDVAKDTNEKIEKENDVVQVQVEEKQTEQVEVVEVEEEEETEELGNLENLVRAIASKGITTEDFEEYDSLLRQLVEEGDAEEEEQEVSFVQVQKPSPMKNTTPWTAASSGSVDRQTPFRPPKWRDSLLSSLADSSRKPSPFEPRSTSSLYNSSHEKSARGVRFADSRPTYPLFNTLPNGRPVVQVGQGNAGMAKRNLTILGSETAVNKKRRVDTPYHFTKGPRVASTPDPLFRF